MSDNHEIELERDCEAIQIPAGLKTTIPAGTRVIITQSLGGSYTIACDYGLFRGSEEKTRAPWPEPRTLLGKSGKTGGKGDEEGGWGQLPTVFDSEISVNIVGLRLV